MDDAMRYWRRALVAGFPLGTGPREPQHIYAIRSRPGHMCGIWVGQGEKRDNRIVRLGPHTLFGCTICGTTHLCRRLGLEEEDACLVRESEETPGSYVCVFSEGEVRRGVFPPSLIPPDH